MNWTFNNKSKYKKILDDAKQIDRASIHSFHRYYGKLIPAIPNAFITEFTEKGDIVGDLFSGSGTVAVEAKLNGRNFIGCEINPLSHLISEVKTTTYDVEKIEDLNNKIFNALESSNNEKYNNLSAIPFCINRDHWFKENVQKDLVLIKDTVDNVISSNCNDNQTDYKNFYYAIISSIIRNVSNADPATVFPGISKKMRALEAEGKIKKNAIKTFINAVKKRTKYFSIYNKLKFDTKIDIRLGNSLDIDLTEYNNKVTLFVTNPPYISSVRYIETMKLEMYWLEYIKNSSEYGKLANLMLGNDKILKANYSREISTNYQNINCTVDLIKQKSQKDAYIVSKYFNDMEKIIIKMNKMLKENGKVVVKISDSNVKKIKVETGKFLTEIAENNGFKLVDLFIDKINENSRSLTTARNTYSDIILNDNILIWEKVKK